MKAVVIGESSGVSMEIIMSVYPRHKAVVDKFIERGDVIGIGPFAGQREYGPFSKAVPRPSSLSLKTPLLLKGL